MSNEANNYKVNSAKQDPQTGILAQCTGLDGDKAWRVYGLNQHYVPYEDVAHWTDLS